jgi:hypothetical protein
MLKERGMPHDRGVVGVGPRTSSSGVRVCALIGIVVVGLVLSLTLLPASVAAAKPRTVHTYGVPKPVVVMLRACIRE